MTDIASNITSNPILALLKNKQLTNAKTWKQLQGLLALLIGIAPFLKFVFPQYAALLSPALLDSLQGAVGSVLAYLTVATTDKIGFGGGK